MVSEGLTAGTLVADRYRVERLLGEGGMGAVYLAQHVLMRKAVALKVLHPDAGEFPEVVARFEREAIAAAHIDHPNIVSATDFGKLPDGSFFLVLEYVDGESLREKIAGGPLTCELALHVVREIASALVAAHESGVVHRDLKPENVMLVARGAGLPAVKIFDFGIAKIDVGRVTSEKGSTLQPITRVGTVFGTPDYMAPEQAMGQPVDGRADLYALGVMLFEMLTGGRPYKGGAVTLMRQHILHEVPELPENIAQTIDTAVGAILKKLMAKDADARYATAGEFVAAVDSITGKTPSAPPASRLQTSQPAPSRAPPSNTPAGLLLDNSGGPAGDSTPSRALTPAIIAPSGKSWRPAAGGAYSAGASSQARKKRRLVAVALGALFIGGIAGGAIWMLDNAKPTATPGRAPNALTSGAPSPGSPESTASANPAATEPTPVDPGNANANANANAANESDNPYANANASSEPTGEAAPAASASAAAPKREAAPRTNPKGSGSGPGRGKRKTGPGGIYVPPPKDWLK